MIIIRNCFTTKPGNASKLAAQLKEGVAASSAKGYRVLTDLTGDFNRVILEFEAESMGEFEKNMKEYESNPAMREKMKGYTELYITGSREILRVV